MELRMLSVVLTLLLVIVPDMWAYPTGMPNTTSVCISMKPGHEKPGQDIAPQSGPPPFTIAVSKTEYKATDTLTGKTMSSLFHKYIVTLL